MLINLKPYFKLLRLKDAKGYFLMALFGFILVKGFLFLFEDIIAFWAIIFSLLGFGFSINDCFDLKEDKMDRTKKNPIVLKEISFKKSFFFSIFFATLGLFLASLFGLKVFLLCLAGVLLTYFYSSPPLRLKSRVLVDLLSHGLFAGPIIFFLPLLIFQAQLTLLHYLIAFSFFCFSIILGLRNQFEDYNTDKEAGLKNTACILGYEKSEKLLNLSAIFYPLSLFPIFLLIQRQYFFSFLIFTLIFIFLSIFKKNYKLVKNYKVLDIYNAFTLSLVLLFSLR
ncbi:UbiA prenyltransferase family protein [Patescibacteria group bacterium]|nr:UbiA prenyltransferase family protein [Patescibacteria group bacterium]